MRVAVVDDDAQLRSLLARVVKCLGYQVSVEAGERMWSGAAHEH